MEDKIIWSLFFLIFIVWGVLCIKFPEFMLRTTATNTLKRKPIQKELKRYKNSGYIMLIFGIGLIVFTLLRGFKNI